MPASRGFAAALVLLAVTACSGGDDLGDASGGPAPTTTTVSSTPSASPTPAPTTAAPTTKPPASKVTGVVAGKHAEDPAVADYTRYLQARFDAFRRRNPRYGPLLALSTPNRQTHDRARIERMLRDGETYEGRIRFAIVGVSTTGSRGRIRACERDDASWFVSRSGERSPVKPQWLPLDVRMVRSGGVWKVDATFDANFSCAEAR